MKVAGIDPGNNGAVAVIDSQGSSNPIILDFYNNSLFEIANWLHNQHVDVIWIEDLHSIFQVTAKSNFGLGRSVGYVQAIAEILKQGDLPKKVSPKVWQRYAGVVKSNSNIKNDIAKAAIQLYPSVNLYGPRGGLRDGRADALLIAHYGLNHHT